MAVPSELPAATLAQALDRGEAVQVLDVRSARRVAEQHISLGAGLDFHARTASAIYKDESLASLGIDRSRPVAVVCGHGNSSRDVAQFLAARGIDAHSVQGGMAAWEAVYIERALEPTGRIAHVVQLDRVGKGALSYILASDGDALLVDPGRHLDRYEAVLQRLSATPVAVIDTHVHADYQSGARAAAQRFGIPYFLHRDDATSPFDATPGKLSYQPVGRGDTIAFGTAAITIDHVPGHTLGSIALIADDHYILTGDFLFVASVGRPDLGGAPDAWARLLWRSLAHAKQAWPREHVILPAHYASESERRADRAVARTFGTVLDTNPALAFRDEPSFLRWLAEHYTVPPAAYRTLKLVNLGLIDTSEADIESLETGPNLCAVSPA
ncbi:MAG TPA: MBL fold metallo-hydrolase [Gemmatimonadales bacterium]|nr:MBL fold metallo-hydrolase [Gemmatimonadales bacterium]